MGHGHKLSCVLCQRFEETKTTGALSTKEQVTAHQNCLLFSSGIYCRDSPQFDDLFGFSAEDVMKEVKRGSKLMCNKCKKRGATAGCEVRRCKKSYHYPCAVQAGAKTVENEEQGNYVLYCFKHCQETQGNSGSVNGCASSFTKPRTSKNPSEAGPSKVYCLACEKTEGNISFESLANSIIMLYCDKHALASHKRNTSGECSAAGPSAYNSDSDSSSSMKHLSSKRRLSFGDIQDKTPSKRKRIITESSDSEENDTDADMAMFAPLDSDLDGSANSVPESQLIRKETENPTGSTSGNQLENERQDQNKDGDETDAESESLLPRVQSSMESQSHSTRGAALTAHTDSAAHPSMALVNVAEMGKGDGEGSSPQQHTAWPSVPQQSSARPRPSPDHSTPRSVGSSPPCTSSAVSPAPPETICVSLLSSPDSPADPKPRVDSTVDSSSFWKSCNAAGCTKTIFADFIKEMNDISSRIQSDQASEEDYDLALTVMEASGKLAELVTKQQKELQRKQTELQKAAEAMKEVVSALRR